MRSLPLVLLLPAVLSAQSGPALLAIPHDEPVVCEVPDTTQLPKLRLTLGAARQRAYEIGRRPPIDLPTRSVTAAYDSVGRVVMLIVIKHGAPTMEVLMAAGKPDSLIGSHMISTVDTTLVKPGTLPTREEIARATRQQRVLMTDEQRVQALRLARWLENMQCEQPGPPAVDVPALEPHPGFLAREAP